VIGLLETDVNIKSTYDVSPVKSLIYKALFTLQSNVSKQLQS